MYQFFCIGSSSNKNMNIFISMILCQIKNFLFDITTPICVDLYAKSKIFYPQIPSVIVLNTTVLVGSKSCRAAVLLLYLLSMDKTLQSVLKKVRQNFQQKQISKKVQIDVGKFNCLVQDKIGTYILTHFGKKFDCLQRPTQIDEKN